MYLIYFLQADCLANSYFSNLEHLHAHLMGSI